jgi:hypothetical protein
MTSPTPDEIGFALDALRAEAALWREQSQALAGVAQHVTDLRIHGFDRTGLFDGFLDAYDEASRTVARHCAEGRAATDDVGATLLAVAKLYASDEAHNIHALRNLY